METMTASPIPTPRKILSLEGGPELDRLVATELLRKLPGGVSPSAKIPPYSTSDAAALEVLHAIAVDGFGILMDGEWAVGRMMAGKWFESARSPSLALAICRAALLGSARP